MLFFEPINFVNNLKYMGIGMLGVFMIIAVIVLSTYLIGYVTNKIEAGKKKDSDSQS